MSTFKIPSEWIPSAAVIDDLRGGLAEMDSALGRVYEVGFQSRIMATWRVAS
jgi:hypothetical protein